MTGVVKNGGVTFGGVQAKNVGQPSPAGQVRPDVAGFNVPLDRDKFAQLIKSHPTDVTWEKAIVCPFLSGPNPLDHDPNCHTCHMGYVYFDAEDIQVFMQSLSVTENYYAYGRNDLGRAQITAMPEYKLSYWDRLTLCNSRTRHTEYVVRKSDGLADRLKYTPICVEAVMWKQRDGSLARFDEGVHFTIDASTGELVWSSVDRPDNKDVYAVSYWHRPVFIVIDVPRDIRDAQIPNQQGVMVSHEFPVQVIAQRDYAIYRESEERPREGDRQSPFPTD